MTDQTPEAPEGTRLILVSDGLLEFFGTRTESGLRLTAEWGEPDEHGWYTPIFTATDDGMTVGPADDLALAAAVRRMDALGTWQVDRDFFNTYVVVIDQTNGYGQAETLTEAIEEALSDD